MRKQLRKCAAMWAIAALTTTGLTAQAQVTVQESFDTLNETMLNGQNGWKSNGKATIQTEFNAQGGGKALKLEAPDGNASKILIPDGMDGIVALDFKLLLDPKEVTPSAKVLFFLYDTEKKRSTLFFHSEANQWGLKTGTNYPQVKRKHVDGKWHAIRLILNFNAKTVSAYVGEGAQWQTVFARQKFDDESARNFASLEIVRNGQGNAAPVYIDEIAVQKVESDAPPAAVASVLSGDTPAKPRFAVFNSGEPVEVVLDAQRKDSAPADNLDWQLLDWRGTEVRRGSLSVSPGKWQGKLRLDALPAGYYALRAKLRNQGDTLAAQGSRPEGILSFGVLSAIPPLSLTADASRFGIWGTNFIKENEWLKGDPYEPLTTTLGTTWSGWGRRWFELEPSRQGEWQPAPSSGEFNYVLRHQMPYVVMLEGIPAWTIDWPAGTPKPEGKLSHVQAQAYAPRDWTAYADFLRRVAREQVALRKAHPYLKRSYYLIHHEPDWHWKGDDAAFIKMYEVAHTALHEGDPQAVLLGPRYGVLKNGLANLERLFPQGLGKHLDGLAFHGYYLPPRLSQSPETAGTPDMVRRLRELAHQYIGPNAFMAQLEWGVRYDLSYEDVTPDLLRRHAAQTARGHLIALGEGARFSYFFYTSDYTGEPGYGITFNLDMPNPDFGAIRTSPKPTYMAAATMSRLLAGTSTIGRIQNANALGYAFKRGDQYLTALWSPTENTTQVRLKTSEKNVQLIDLMGNSRSTTGGAFTLKIDGNPIYVLSGTPLTVEN